MVPFVEKDLVDFADGAKLKRPKTLHPHLPFAVEVSAGAEKMGDIARFFVKSPLAGPAVPDAVASAFWAALQAQTEGRANMQVATFSMGDPGATFEMTGVRRQKGGKGKRLRPTPLTVRVPVLTNSVPVQRGEVLVFTGALVLDNEADENAE